jgi:DNA-binding FadR family transcriptional regulator
MATAVNRFVRGRKLSLRTLQKTREALEPVLARLAARHRSERDPQALKSLHAQLVAFAGNFREFAQNNVKWHNAVATTSGNDLLAFLYAISYSVHVATMSEAYDTNGYAPRGHPH